ncbi:acyl-CoA synthetase short-chain family member 1, isoform CRA_b [Mus musculus]|nr:acyl-CoA synthetase short-chain family member 1, isoform CRA_b [Mus musculus]
MAARSLGSGVGRLLRGLQGRSGQSGWSLSVSRSTATRLPGCVPAAAQPGSYPALSAQAAQEPAAFWGPLARDTLVWDTPYHTVWDCDFRTGKIGWFLGGQLNVSVNCLDQHVQKSPETIALIWERDEPGTEVRITYRYCVTPGTLNTQNTTWTFLRFGFGEGD